MLHCSTRHQQQLQEQAQQEAAQLATNYFSSGNSSSSSDTPKAYDPNWLVNSKAAVQSKVGHQQTSAAGAPPAASPQNPRLAAAGAHSGEAAAAGREGLEDGELLVSLADFPQVTPWRPLLAIKELMLPRGLAAPPAVQVAKRARDLRELQGKFLLSDHEKGAQGLVGSALFTRVAAREELAALARAQMPMTAVSTACFAGLVVAYTSVCQHFRCLGHAVLARGSEVTNEKQSRA